MNEPDEKERAQDERERETAKWIRIEFPLAMKDCLSNCGLYKERDCHKWNKTKNIDNRIYGLNRKPENESELNLPIEFKIMSRKRKMKKS